MNISELLKVGHAARKVSNLENAMLAVVMACKGLSADYCDQAIYRANLCKFRSDRKSKISDKKTAYLLERKNEKNGKYEPYELKLETHCNIWEEDWNNPKFSEIECPMLDVQSMEEFPNVIVTDGSD